MSSKPWWKIWPGARAGKTASAPSAREAPKPEAPTLGIVSARHETAVPAGAPQDDPMAGSEVSLLHMLTWRARVLEIGVGGTRVGDGPAFARFLVQSGTTIIRQPPIAAQRALLMSRDLGVDHRELVRLIESDPTLAPRLLQTANSAWYRSTGEPVVAISDGVRRIGLRGVEGVVLTQMAQSMVCRPGGVGDRMVEQIWLHMLRTAPIARRIAPAFDANPEEAYALGLLHDIGKLLIFDHLAQLRHELRSDAHVREPFLSAMLRGLHEPLGGLVALRWGMGADAAAAIATHHRDTPNVVPSRLAEVIHVAEILDHATMRSRPFDWEAVWNAGRITADLAQVQARAAAVAEDETDDDDDGTGEMRLAA